MRMVMRGFTYIEILVVLAILALAASIVIPQLGNNDNIRVPAAARMVMSDLQFAQHTAITHQSPVFVYFMNDDQSTPRTAYTLAMPQSGGYWSSLSFSTVKAAGTSSTNAGGFTSGGITGHLLKQPSTQGRYLVQFGSDNTNAPGPLANTIITSVKRGTTSINMFGFDSKGQPIEIDPADSSKTKVITQQINMSLSNKGGTATSSLIIQPYTGEITEGP